jgi:hypothetical protein
MGARVLRIAAALVGLVAATLQPTAAHADARCGTNACASGYVSAVDLGCDYYYPPVGSPYADCWFGFYGNYSGSSTLPIGTASAAIYGSASGSSSCNWTLGGCASSFYTNSAFVRIFACDSAYVSATLYVTVVATAGHAEAEDSTTLFLDPWAC